MQSELSDRMLISGSLCFRTTTVQAFDKGCVRQKHKQTWFDSPPLWDQRLGIILVGLTGGAVGDAEGIGAILGAGSYARLVAGAP